MSLILYNHQLYAAAFELEPTHLLALFTSAPHDSSNDSGGLRNRNIGIAAVGPQHREPHGPTSLCPRISVACKSLTKIGSSSTQSPFVR